MLSSLVLPFLIQFPLPEVWWDSQIYHQQQLTSTRWDCLDPDYAWINNAFTNLFGIRYLQFHTSYNLDNTLLLPAISHAAHSNENEKVHNDRVVHPDPAVCSIWNGNFLSSSIALQNTDWIMSSSLTLVVNLIFVIMPLCTVALSLVL